MLNPSVGDILEISSPTSLLRIVVFPALSNPLVHQPRSHLDEPFECMMEFREGAAEDKEVDVQEKNPHFL